MCPAPDSPRVDPYRCFIIQTGVFMAQYQTWPEINVMYQHRQTYTIRGVAACKSFMRVALPCPESLLKKRLHYSNLALGWSALAMAPCACHSGICHSRL